MKRGIAYVTILFFTESVRENRYPFSVFALGLHNDYNCFIVLNCGRLLIHVNAVSSFFLILGYGVAVALQILVLSVMVRIRVSQLYSRNRFFSYDD